MTTMYRFDQLHSERKSLALLKDHEWGFDYMRSFKARHKRENCVFDTAPEPEA
jgi:predicted glycosyltransferase involved in capsule biosynthesis